MNKHKAVLIVVTSHDRFQGGETGVWLSEFSEAYYEFTKRGYEVAVASPLGGKGPVDPNSVDEHTSQDILDAEIYLENTIKLDEVTAEDYDAIYFPGGYGAMFDLPENGKLQDLLRNFIEDDKIVATVCHGAAALVGTTLANGQPLVAGKRVNAFTDYEEIETGADEFLPFLLESKLRHLGSTFVAAPNWSSHVEIDGNLITGQNPQSTMALTRAIIEELG